LRSFIIIVVIIIIVVVTVVFVVVIVFIIVIAIISIVIVDAASTCSAAGDGTVAHCPESIATIRHYNVQIVQFQLVHQDVNAC
jgi:hypothetical protein